MVVQLRLDVYKRQVLAELPLLPLQFEVVQDSDWSYYQELLDKLQP